MADDGGLRRRVPAPRQDDATSGTAAVETVEPVSAEETKREAGVEVRPAAVLPGSYWLTRIVFIRSLGFVYCESRDQNLRSHANYVMAYPLSYQSLLSVWL